MIYLWAVSDRHAGGLVCRKEINNRHFDVLLCVRAVSDRHELEVGFFHGPSDELEVCFFNGPLRFCSSLAADSLAAQPFAPLHYNGKETQ